MGRRRFAVTMGIVPAQPHTRPRAPALVWPPGRYLGVLAIAVAAISTSGPLIAATAAPALAIAFWRNGMASGLLLPWTLVRRHADVRMLDGRSWRLSVIAGVLLAAHFATWVPSLTLTSVASSTALVASQPVWASIFAHVGGQRLPRAMWVGIVVSVAGTALLAGIDLDTSTRALGGDLLALLGGGLAAGYVTVGSVVREKVSTTVYTTICYSACALLLLAACLVGRQPLAGYPAVTWLKLAGLTVGAQLLGHSLINVVLKHASATVVSLAILFEVPGASLVAAVWLHQIPSALAMVGLAVLLLGTGIVAVQGTRSGQSVAEPAA